MIKKSKIINLAKVLKKRLPADVFRLIRKISSIAEEENISAYLVGGFVRDLLLGADNLDLDIVVEGDAISFAKALIKRLDLQVVTHQRFGTATVSFPEGIKIDIASARKEYYVSCAVLPTVTFSSIREDLFRRDFTINAMAININRDGFGQLLDLFGGQRDLREGVLRILHQKSFSDDPTRVFRAIRYAQRYNFHLERSTVQLMLQAKKLGMLKKLSRSRVGNEIILMLKEKDSLSSLARINSFCGLEIVHPGIRLDRQLKRQFKSAQIAIKAFNRNGLKAPYKNWLVYFIILVKDLRLVEIKQLCRDFSLTKKDRQKLESFQKHSSCALSKINRKGALGPDQIYHICQPFSKEEVLVLFCLSHTKEGRERIKLFIHKLSKIDLNITGSDLKRIGFKPGPQYKVILQKVLQAKVAGKLRSKSDEINYARTFLSLLACLALLGKAGYSLLLTIGMPC